MWPVPGPGSIDNDNGGNYDCSNNKHKHAGNYDCSNNKPKHAGKLQSTIDNRVQL
jgi:hypothetical protein